MSKRISVVKAARAYGELFCEEPNYDYWENLLGARVVTLDEERICRMEGEGLLSAGEYDVLMELLEE